MLIPGVFQHEIDSYRARRRRGTRLPLDWSNTRAYLTYLVVAVAVPAGGGDELLFDRDAAWQRVVGALLWLIVMAQIALFIRWWRRPIDGH